MRARLEGQTSSEDQQKQLQNQRQTHGASYAGLKTDSRVR
jgi:hypothetical protein